MTCAADTFHRSRSPGKARAAHAPVGGKPSANCIPNRFRDMVSNSRGNVFWLSCDGQI
jgi:hypothetical protein